VDEKGSRPLFSEREDDLTYNEADRILNPTSGELEKEDVIHVVISPERGSFERAGETDEERKKTLREAIRDAVHKMARELKVRTLNWIGGLHGNTRTPHGHLAVSRWALDEKTGKLVYIKHLPESLLPRNREGEDGTKRFSTGKIAEVFARALNLRRKPVRFVQVQDREGGIEISRSVLSPYALMLREPTPQERVVGRWIEAELTHARAVGEGGGGKEELTRECIELRGLVAELDAGARAQGARPTAGYVEPERLEELIRGNLGALRVNVFTERPQGQEERYVERTIEKPGTSAAKEILAVPPALKPGEVKVPLSTAQVISEPSPANAAPVKFARQREDAQDKVEVMPRVATTTLAEMRSHIVLSRSPDAAAIDKASEAREAIKGHDGGTQQIGTKQGAQSVERVAKLTPPISIIPSARTERPLADAATPGEKLASTKEPLKESRLSDEELGRLAHSVRFNRLYMERERDVLAAVTRTEIEQLQASGDRDSAKTVAALEPLYSFESRVRESILLDHIYDDARQKRNIPSQQLSDTQADLLKGRESWQVTELKNSLPGQMESAREQLLAVAPLADPSRVKMYNKYQEEQLALAALARDWEKQTTASRDIERPTAETLERDSHSIPVAALPGKEAAPSQALVEEAIELIL
jgi:hypothetical protein